MNTPPPAPPETPEKPALGGWGFVTGARHDCSALRCDEVRRRYREGISPLRVDAEMGLAEGRAVKILRYHHEPRPPHRRPPPLPPWAADAETHYRAGETMERVAQRLGMTRERVRQILMRLGVPSRPPARRHECADACAAVLAATPPIRVLPFAKSTGISSSRLIGAMRFHGIASAPRERRGHVCNEQCAKALQALRDGLSMRQAAIVAGFAHVNTLSQRHRIYHPDWPWPRAEWWLRDKKERPPVTPNEETTPMTTTTPTTTNSRWGPCPVPGCNGQMVGRHIEMHRRKGDWKPEYNDAATKKAKPPKERPVSLTREAVQALAAKRVDAKGLDGIQPALNSIASAFKDLMYERDHYKAEYERIVQRQTTLDENVDRLRESLAALTTSKPRGPRH